MNLKVKLTGPTGKNAQVLLDGHDISSGLEGLQVSIGVGDVNRARLTILVDSLDIDAQTLAVLQAHVEANAAMAAAEAKPEIRTFPDTTIQTPAIGDDIRRYEEVISHG